MNRHAILRPSEWLANARAMSGSAMFWALFGSFIVGSLALWALPTQPIGLLIRALITGMSIALVITHFNAAVEFFQPLDDAGQPGGPRHAGHWYAFSHWIGWVFLSLSMIYGYAYVWMGRPDSWPLIPLYNNIMGIAVYWVGIQLAIPYLAHDETGVLRLRIAGNSSRVLLVALLVAVFTTLALILISALE